MNKNKFIAFDIGAESGRCFVGLLNGQEFEFNEVHRFPTHTALSNKGIHWDILAIFGEILKGLTEAVGRYGKHFDGIGITTWGVDYVLIDKDGGILSYPYHYRDSRTDRMPHEAFEIISKESLYALTGNQPAQYNTVFQFLSEFKRQTNLLHLADKFLLTPDFFNFMLTGKTYSEYTIASTTGITDQFTRKWSSDVIDIFKFPKDIFPEIIEPGTKVGTLLEWLADKTGLESGIPVYAVAEHDTASAAASLPLSDDSAFLISGTWSLLGVKVSRPLTDADALRSGFTNEGGIERSTYLLKNIIGMWPLQQCRNEWQVSSPSTYSELVNLAVKEGYVKSWINLDDPRFLKTGKMLERIYSFLKETGQTVKDDKGFITAVILESLAYNYRFAIKQLESVAGKNISSIYSSGGGIKNELLSQYIADATGIEVFAGPVEGAVIGNIAVQAVASGAAKDISSFLTNASALWNIKKYEPVNTLYFNENSNYYQNIMNSSNTVIAN